MDVKALAQAGVDSFNDRSFREKAKDMMDPGVVVIDTPTGRELHGPDGYIQLSEGFINAIPDLKGTAIEHNVNANPVDIEYQLEQEFNDAGKVVRFATNYDMQDFMHQLGM